MISVIVILIPLRVFSQKPLGGKHSCEPHPQNWYHLGVHITPVTFVCESPQGTLSHFNITSYAA